MNSINIMSNDEMGRIFSHYSSTKPINEINQLVTDYPVDAFPNEVRQVISALSYRMQVSPELVGGVILSAISLACQAFVNLQLPDGRTKPCSLYNMVLAGSGERKSAVYSLVMRPFLDYEKEQRLEYEKGLKKYNAKIYIWEEEKKVLNKKIKNKMLKEDDYEYDELEEHFLKKPESPKKIKLVYSDTTPEALQKGLHVNIPYAGLMSDEASIFFAGRAKNNLGFLNQLWDGSPFDVERRNGSSFSVEGRFSMLLMIQPDLFMQYFKRHGKVASGSGFLSRFLISSVNSTQGHRQISFENNEISELKFFHQRIAGFLARLNEFMVGYNIQTQLTLAESAHACFSQFQFEIEKVICDYNNEAITASLSKMPENAIRLAGLMSFFCDEENPEISGHYMEKSIVIIGYYTNQVINLYTEKLNTLEQDAEFVYQWLQKQEIIKFVPEAQISRVAVQQYIGPKRLRNKARLDAVLKILDSQGRIRLTSATHSNGAISTIILHPDSPF